MDEIAICGVSARIANCKNLKEFTEALLNGDDLITHDHKRWNCNFLKTPRSIGVLAGLENFDAKFFGINFKLADQLDPRTRQLLEVVFESIVDAGYNPQDLRGSNTAVILAVAENSNEGLMNRSLAIMANTISYYLDLKGPSYALDTGCSSSLYALNQAVEALSFGSCDKVVVCSAQTHLLPTDSIQLNKMGILSTEGKCKTFDDDRDGYVKSEGVVSIFLQKQNKARRIYATIAGIGCNVDGFKEEGMSNPSTQSQLNLLRRIYKKFGLDPNEVEYIDAHGTGTLIGDIKECATLEEFFATTGRAQRLKIGSVKSNAGHCENAAGLVSLVKLLIAVNTGIIPANIHFTNVALDIPSVENERLEVVQNNTQYGGGLLAINSFGIGGANGHAVIRPYLKNHSGSTSLEKTRLVLVSGRTEDSVKKLLGIIEENQENLGSLTLLDNIFEKPIKNYPYKGFTLLNGNEKEIQKCKLQKPIWFSYSGMGSQWPGMAKHLMNFNIFRDTVEKCSTVLKPYGIDLKDVVLNGDDKTFEDPEKCFPAIILVSVGLTNVLYGIGIKPDGIIGHSLGEIGCAYGDGLVTAEQAILMAHARGLATKQTKLLPGLMASVGLTIEECQKILPKDVYVACHNSRQNVTISGPETSVKVLVNDLEPKGIFARIVNTAGIAFHSKYIHEVGPTLMEMLNRILPDPKKRSSKWLPSAIPECDYDSYLGKFNSAEYHHHNFMNVVLYKQVLDKVPKEAILIEIAPRGLFQAIFRRAVDKNIVKLHLANKDIEDNLEFFLTTIGRIFLSTNISLDLKSLNERSLFPLNGKTPFISPLIQWDHSLKWHVPNYVRNRHQGEKIVLNLRSKEFKFLYGHVINGSAVFPASGLLFLAWKAFAHKNEKEINECPVTLQNVQLINTVMLEDVLEFNINILESGHFEIITNDVLAAKGKIAWLKEPRNRNSEAFQKNRKEQISAEDIYKEFYLRGYGYSDSFKGIQNLSVSGRSGHIRWFKNWISFMDTVMQSVTLYQYSDLVVPTKLSQVSIDSNEHQKLVMREENVLKYHYNEVTKTALCGGFQIHNLICTKMKVNRVLQTPILNHYDFISNDITYQGQHIGHLEFSLSMTLQIVMENNTKRLTTYIAKLDDEENNLQDIISKVVTRRFFKNLKVSCVKEFSQVSHNNTDLLICSFEENLSITDTLEALAQKVFIFCRIKDTVLNDLCDNVVFRCSEGGASYVLLRKCCEIPKNIEVVHTNTQDFLWIEKVKENLSKVDHKTYLVSNSLTTGLIGFFNCLKEELQAGNLRVFIVDSKTIEEFNINSDFWRSQVKKDLTINIYEKNRWCTYRTLPIKYKGNKEIKNCYLDIQDDKLRRVKSNIAWTKNLVSVQYACLNQWDKANCQQNLITDGCQNLSMGFSGKSNSGKNIIGLTRNGCLRNLVEPEISWYLPRNLNFTLEEAATIPLDYTIAYYALYIKGKIKTSDNILICGTDSTCLAAIFFLLEQGCHIFIETKNPNEIPKVKSFFEENPKLNFFSFNDPNSLKEIMSGKIDVLFFSDEANINRHHTEILAKDSRVISIYQENTEIDSDVLNEFILKECQTYRIDLNTILLQDVNLVNIIQDYLNENALKPFKYVSGENSLEHVVEFLNRNSEEKLVLSIDHNDFDSRTVHRKLYFDCNRSYILVGGLGGVGLEITKWLIKRGATKIILNSRSSVATGYAKFLLNQWLGADITVIINNSDAKSVEGATTLLEVASKIAPVGGIFNLAMVLKDKVISDLTPSDFLEVVAPKLHISRNLDELSQKLCSDLQYFVVFSAMTALGNQGQSNYGFANSAIEMLCKNRTSRGLPALAIQWGCIGDVGYVSRQNFRKNLLREIPQSIHSCLKTLESLLLQDDVDVISSALYEAAELGNAVVGKSSQDGSILDLLASVLGGRNADDLERDVPLVNLGVDSISLLEIRNLIQEECSVAVPSCKLRNMTLEQIQELKN